MAYKLEICIDNMESAVAAVAGGADRLAVCQALDLGGLTPSPAFIGMVKQKFSIPVYMFIRPKSGICMYTDDEIHLMKTDIECGLHLKVDGFVFGALKMNKCIDRIACRSIVDAACGKPVTFHRVFDFAEEDEAYINIIDLGFKRIITSGCRGTAYEGIHALKRLVDLAGSQITIMPGSGINHYNIKEIAELTGAVEFHSSGEDPDRPRLRTPNFIVKGAESYPHTSMDTVQKMRQILTQLQQEKNLTH